MENDLKRSALIDFVEKNIETIKKVEWISFSILTIGLISYYFKIPNMNFILVIGIISTAITLFLQAYKVYEFESIEAFNLLGAASFINFIYKLYFFSLSISTVSLIGFIHLFRKSNPFAFCGGSTIIIVLILTLFTKVNDKYKVYDFKFYFRILICLLLLSIMAFDKGIIK